MTIRQRLEELLETKDTEILRLNEELEKFQEDEEKVWEWAHHRSMEKDTDDGLPVPRLEIRWFKDSDDGYLQHWEYCMIYQHTLGHLVAIPLGNTTIQGGKGEPIYNGKISTPYRDGVHIVSDAKQLALSAFIIVEDHIARIWLDEDGHCQQEMI